MKYRGINYDTGTNYAPGYLSREDWSHEGMCREIQVIARQLRCNAIQIYGSDLQRIIACGQAALAEGLHVWLQPRLIDAQPEETLAHLSELAKRAEALREKYTQVALTIGCELTIFMSGIVPGKTYSSRASKLLLLWPFMSYFSKKLNLHLNAASQIAREHFKGTITYGAGIWEAVEWSHFSQIGLNYYRESANASSYEKKLREFHRYNKPIIITEFGCCTYTGADKKGASGDGIVNWSNPRQPRLKHGRFQRNEAVQARYIQELYDIFVGEGVTGAFVFQFIEPSYPHCSNPLYDLDMASFAVVKFFPGEMNEEPGHWEPKQAFGKIAELYGSEQAGMF